ncbi:MAG: hypothetical protein R3302_05300, partial [Sulfurimonadaceae bacterium]|nr:hypothetical protein [Sulfurimonadaceae bacterium]
IAMPIFAGGGTSCPQTLRILQLDADGLGVSEPFGNCSDYLSVVKEEETYHFLFNCGCAGECYERYASYHCSFSLENGLKCVGEDHCSRYSCEESTQQHFYEALIDDNGFAEENYIYRGSVRKVNCVEQLESE